MTINEQCCSQANTEDIAPPASEDKNRLKVKKKEKKKGCSQPINELQNQIQK